MRALLFFKEHERFAGQIFDIKLLDFVGATIQQNMLYLIYLRMIHPGFILVANCLHLDKNESGKYTKI